jgi:hypothetical protein
LIQRIPLLAKGSWGPLIEDTFHSPEIPLLNFSRKTIKKRKKKKKKKIQIMSLNDVRDRFHKFLRCDDYSQVQNARPLSKFPG